jgi:hypothetical protein
MLEPPPEEILTARADHVCRLGLFPGPVAICPAGTPHVLVGQRLNQANPATADRPGRGNGRASTGLPVRVTSYPAPLPIVAACRPESG